jgi:hypothetical protein
MSLHLVHKQLIYCTDRLRDDLEHWYDGTVILRTKSTWSVKANWDYTYNIIECNSPPSQPYNLENCVLNLSFHPIISAKTHLATVYRISTFGGLKYEVFNTHVYTNNYRILNIRPNFECVHHLDPDAQPLQQKCDTCKIVKYIEPQSSTRSRLCSLLTMLVLFSI